MEIFIIALCAGRATGAWIGMIGVVAGALLGGGLAWLNSRFQLRYQEERDRKKLFLGKLEELYEVVSQMKNAYRHTEAAQWESLSARRALSDDDLIPIPEEKLEMLVGFYAPGLKPQLNTLRNDSEEISKAFVKRIGLERKDETEQKQFIGELRPLIANLTKTCEEIQKEIVTLSKNQI